MHPVLFSLGATHVRSYGILATAMCVACGLTLFRYRAELGMSGGRLVDMMLAIVGVGVIGGRLGAALLYPSGTGWRDALLNSGFSSFHGAWGALAGFLLFCRATGTRPMGILDYLGVAVPLGHAFGRLGCFLSGCCYGRPTGLPWGVRFPAGDRIPDHLVGVALHPTQLYEAVMDLLIAGMLHVLLRRRARRGEPADGSLFPWYVIAYGLGRFALDPLRGDDPGRLAGFLTTAQIMAAAQVLVAGLWAAYLRAARNKIVTAQNV